MRTKFKLMTSILLRFSPSLFLFFPLPPAPFSSLGIFHCVFGDLQESLLSCCRGALDTAAQEKDKTIVFWLDGFAAVSGEWRVIIFEKFNGGMTILLQSWSFFVTVQCKNQLLA